MKTNIPQQIIVPVYYFIDEDENVNFDIEQMRGFFENELQKVVFGTEIKYDTL
jgi:predicted glycosyltransferase involved in capsule biosynthesis